MTAPLQRVRRRKLGAHGATGSGRPAARPPGLISRDCRAWPVRRFRGKCVALVGDERSERTRSASHRRPILLLVPW